MKLLCILISLSLIYSSAVAIENDKKKHFGVSLAIGTAVGIYINSKYQENSDMNNILIATSISMVPGLLKEVYDSGQTNNYFSGEDLLYDLLGSVVGSITGNYIGNRLFVDVKRKTIAYNMEF
jgi:VanZ family protein